MEPMNREAVLDAIDELVDRQLGISIAVMRVDLELGKQVADLNIAWRELAMKAAGITYEPGEQLRRHFDAKGE